MSEALTKPAPVSEILRTGFTEIARENVHRLKREESHRAKEEQLQRDRRLRGKPEPKRFRKTLL